MSETLSQPNRSNLEIPHDQSESAALAIGAIIDQPESVRASDADGTFQKQETEGYCREDIKVEDIHTGTALIAYRIRARDSEAYDPNRIFETLNMVADLPGIARAQVMLKNNRPEVVFFRDDQNQGARSSELSPENLENAQMVIAMAQEQLASADVRLPKE